MTRKILHHPDIGGILVSSVLKSNQIAQHVTAEGMAKAKAAAARANGGRWFVY